MTYEDECRFRRGEKVSLTFEDKKNIADAFVKTLESMSTKDALFVLWLARNSLESRAFLKAYEQGKDPRDVLGYEPDGAIKQIAKDFARIGEQFARLFGLRREV